MFRLYLTLSAYFYHSNGKDTKTRLNETSFFPAWLMRFATKLEKSEFDNSEPPWWEEGSDA